MDPSAALHLVERRLSALPTGLQAHIERVRGVGRELSDRLGADAGRVDLALAAHDLFRAADDADLLAEAARRGWEADPIEQAEPLLLHGPVAGLWLLQEAGVDDPEVIDAVTWHTTYAPGLGLLAATVFLADKVDPQKVEDRPWLADVKERALDGAPEAAVELYLSRLLIELVDSGGPAHPRALEALNSLRIG